MADPKNKKCKRRLKWLALLLLLVAGGGYGYRHFTQEKPPETYAIAPVEQGILVDKLAETGTIELVRTVEVKSTISGEIRQLEIEAGDWVEKGQVMAVIEPDPNQSLQLYQKRSGVEQAKISLQEQERDFARQKTLFASRMVSSKDFEDAEMRLVRGRSNLRLAQLELGLLETKANLSSQSKDTPLLDEVHVLAPIGGIVIQRGVEMGEVVASGLSAMSGGTVLFVIGDPSQMIVRGNIAEIDIGQLQTGQEVEIVVDAFPDTMYSGQVRWIAPVGEKKPGNTIVTFDTEVDILDADPLLRQGMSCDLDIIFSCRDSALYLPPEAIAEVLDEDQEEAKGRRRRFVVYAVAPADSAAADTMDTPTDQEESGPLLVDQANAVESQPDSLGADSREKEEPERVPLERFVEREVQVGLETSTRTEVLEGLSAGARVAADAELIRKEIERAREKSKEPKKGWF